MLEHRARKTFRFLSPIPILLITTVLLGSVGMSWGADWAKGLDAVNRGDYATALREWKPLAEKGDSRAQNGLGVMYMRGWGVPKDFKASLEWLASSAANGQRQAKKNIDSVKKLLRKTGMPGRQIRRMVFAAETCARLDTCGTVVEANFKESIQEILLPLDQSKIIRRYAKQFARGVRAMKSAAHREALSYWKPLAEKGHARAQNAIGTLYWKRRGSSIIPVDLKKALKWIVLSAAQGEPRAANERGIQGIKNKVAKKARDRCKNDFRDSLMRNPSPPPIKILKPNPDKDACFMAAKREIREMVDEAKREAVAEAKALIHRTRTWRGTAEIEREIAKEFLLTSFRGKAFPSVLNKAQQLQDEAEEAFKDQDYEKAAITLGAISELNKLVSKIEQARKLEVAREREAERKAREMAPKVARKKRIDMLMQKMESRKKD